MSFVSRLSYLLTGPTPERKSAWDLVPIGVQGRPQYPDTSIDNVFTQYKRSELLYAAVTARADSAVGPRLHVARRPTPDAEWTEEPGHPFSRLWARPNDRMTAADFTKAWITSVDLTGRFYAEIERSAAQAPVTLHPLNAGQVGQKIGEGNQLTGYEFREGSKKIALRPEQMLSYAEYDPEAPRWGALSRAAVCLGSIDADNALTDWVRGFFNNSAVPSGILHYKGVLGDPAKGDAIRAMWRDRYGRAYGKLGDIGLMDDNMTYEKVGANPDELESAIIRMVTESRVFMTFKVPPLIVYSYAGLLRATYSNLKEAWASYWDSTLYTLYEQLRTWLQWNLLTEYEDPEAILGERVCLQWDFSKVPWLQEDVTAKETRARTNFQAGGITLNEYRAAIGEQPDPRGNYYLRLGHQVEVPAGDASGDNSATVRVYGGAAPVPALVGG